MLYLWNNVVLSFLVDYFHPPMFPQSLPVFALTQIHSCGPTAQNNSKWAAVEGLLDASHIVNGPALV